MKKQSAACPIGKVVSLVGDSCSILIIRDLLEGPKRFSELEASLSISTRTLAKKLKHLEHEDMVTRGTVQEEPRCTKYRLAKKGAAFHKVVDAMSVYGKKYL